LTTHIKELSNIHAQFDAEKVSLKDEIVGVIAKRLGLRGEIRRLEGGLSNLSAAKQVDMKKIMH